MKKKYVQLTVTAKVPDTEIWLADDEGNLVQKEIGKMDTSLLPGNYVVHFGLHETGMPFTLIDAEHPVSITQGPPD